MVWTPARVSPALKTSSTTRIGDSLPRCGFLSASGIGSWLSSHGSSCLNDRQPRRLDRIHHGDERLEGRLETEQAVLVGLVRTDRDLDRAVEIHPQHVRAIGIVRQQRLGARLEEETQAGVVRERGRLAQQSGAPLQRLAEELPVRNGDQLTRPVAAHHALQAVQARLARLDAPLLRGGQIERIEVGAGRMRPAAQERLAIHPAIPRTGVQPEVVAQRPRQRSVQQVRARFDRAATGTGLLVEQIVHDARGGDQLVQRPPARRATDARCPP